MFRDLLVHVDGSQAGLRRVRFAAELARLCGARLTGLHVTPPADLAPRHKPSALKRAERGISSNLAADARAAAANFRKEPADSSLETRWQEAKGDIARGVAAYARYADLVIVGQYEWQEPTESHPLPVAGSVAQRCGRPVLVVPEDVESCALEKAAIAWDASRETVRAVHDALPLLCLAASVEIVTMTDPQADEDPADGRNLLAHLAMHGIKDANDLGQISKPHEHDALRKRIGQGDYDLLVMGGYSQPAWIEYLFGGVTQSILLSSKIPILVSH